MAATSILADLTWFDAQAALHPDAVVLLPVGAIEAHGPHLPLDTDVAIAKETARRGAMGLNITGIDCVIAPAIQYGTSYVGACFPGTVPIPADTVTATVLEVVRSLAVWGPRRFCIANAHLEPAHVAALQSAVTLANGLPEVRAVSPDVRSEPWAARLSAEFQRGMRHAGSYETSLMLAIAPEQVRQDLLPGLEPVLVDLPARLKAGARTFAEAGGIDGYFGDPARATASEGERLFEILGTIIVEAVLGTDR